MNGLIGTDRYGGMDNWPDPATVCPGKCEGMGVYPEMPTDEHGRVNIDSYRVDEVRFVTCETCGGTGRAPLIEGVSHAPSPD